MVHQMTWMSQLTKPELLLYLVVRIFSILCRRNLGRRYKHVTINKLKKAYIDKINNYSTKLFTLMWKYWILSNLVLQIKRLHLLLTINESALDVPTNVEARRRILFFTNSLYMKMPPPPKIRTMLSFRFFFIIKKILLIILTHLLTVLWYWCSVLTPYYEEKILYTRKELEDKNDDGVSILFYLQKIYPGKFEPS